MDENNFKDIAIHVISLGCAKNRVNTEQMMMRLHHAGYYFVQDPDWADVAIINTCGFIDSAKSEAIDEILDIAQLKGCSQLKKIIVTGCLAERYRDEIKQEMPEVDALVGVGSYQDIVEVVEATLEGRECDRFGDKHAPVDEVGRFLTTGPEWAYIKIAEGCDNRCNYCAIPDIRGRFRSRPIENIIAEATSLAEIGVKELILIAQDLTRYGTDLYGERRLAELCRELSDIEGIEWLRLHYLYPNEIDDELIDEVASNPKIVKYLDIPIQHINTEVLRRMNRRGSSESYRELFKKLRERIPGLVLRTSLIVGHPGEGEEEFEELCEFLKEAKIERAGVFPYSPEEGTPSEAMPDRCDEDTAYERANLVRELQGRIIDDYNESRMGSTVKVLCDGCDGAYRIGRSYADSPDVDDKIYFLGDCEPGDFVNVRITGWTEEFFEGCFLAGEQVD
ncbi:MAG: 30S ribosomal protein S12 methylthiotransferase RimO [Clostridia bacterium]|nr:30S ribosomal protein S12 methylthiotransferase RimO [Oscillospiraceae bacterium]MBQ9733890.1 30S ribosomal protein S12 methylthiotransferase RimO [Clostridia bacterium]